MTPHGHWGRTRFAARILPMAETLYTESPPGETIRQILAPYVEGLQTLDVLRVSLMVSVADAVSVTTSPVERQAVAEWLVLQAELIIMGGTPHLPPEDPIPGPPIKPPTPGPTPVPTPVPTWYGPTTARALRGSDHEHYAD